MGEGMVLPGIGEWLPWNTKGQRNWNATRLIMAYDFVTSSPPCLLQAAKLIMLPFWGEKCEGEARSWVHGATLERG